MASPLHRKYSHPGDSGGEDTTLLPHTAFVVHVNPNQRLFFAHMKRDRNVREFR